MRPGNVIPLPLDHAPGACVNLDTTRARLPAKGENMSVTSFRYALPLSSAIASIVLSGLNAAPSTARRLDR